MHPTTSLNRCLSPSEIHLFPEPIAQSFTVPQITNVHFHCVQMHPVYPYIKQSFRQKSEHAFLISIPLLVIYALFQSKQDGKQSRAIRIKQRLAHTEHIERIHGMLLHDGIKRRDVIRRDFLQNLPHKIHVCYDMFLCILLENRLVLSQRNLLRKNDSNFAGAKHSQSLVKSRFMAK